MAHDVGSDKRAAICRRRRRGPSPVSIAVGVVVVVGAAAGISLAAMRSGRSRPPVRHTIARRACAIPVTASPVPAPARIGSWPFHLLAGGVFPAVAADGPRALALEACGAEESSLRVVEFDPATGASVASAPFAHAAPIASAVAASRGAVWFGESRLALEGAADTPPYELALVELRPGTLAPERTIRLGRGYGLSLLDSPGGLVVSTGRQLLVVDAAGSVHPVASFPGVVVQRIAMIPGGAGVLASLFRPSAVGPASSTALSVVDLASGRVTATTDLPGGAEVESLAVGGRSALVAVGRTGATSLERFAISSLRRVSEGARNLPATLASLNLAAGRRSVFAYGPTTVACLAVSAGQVTASTPARDAAEDITSLAEASGELIAALPAGIGRLEAPSGCR